MALISFNAPEPIDYSLELEEINKNLEGIDKTLSRGFDKTVENLHDLSGACDVMAGLSTPEIEILRRRVLELQHQRDELSLCPEFGEEDTAMLTEYNRLNDLVGTTYEKYKSAKEAYEKKILGI